MSSIVEDRFLPEGRPVEAERGWSWIVEAWGLFRRQPATWIGIVLVLFAIYVGFALVPLGSLVMLVLGPVFAGGIVLGCRALDRGEALRFDHLFAGFQKDLRQLALAGALYFAGWIAAAIVAGLLTGLGVGGLIVPGSPTHSPFAALLAALVMLALTLPLVMAVWFAPALIVLNALPAPRALAASFRACARNVVPFLVYGLVGLGLAIAASVPLGLGWLLLGPVLAASVYTAYRDIFYGR